MLASYVLCLQYYFETIFPRIPKPVMDNLVQELKALGLPTTPKVCEKVPAKRGLASMSMSSSYMVVKSNYLQVRLLTLQCLEALRVVAGGKKVVTQH
jgi:hypothetical protein